MIFLAGFVDAIAGGGGLLSVPAYLAAGLPPHFALGTNKFSSVCGTILTTTRYYRAGMMDKNIAIPGAIAALIGSALGTLTVLALNPSFLNYILIILIPLITLFVMINKNLGKIQREHFFSGLQVLIIALLLGFVLGFYDGFFGPGTGSFLIFSYVLFLGLDYTQANANAKVINLASNLAAVITFIIGGKVIYALAIPAAICGIAGNWLGSKMVIKNKTKIIRPFFITVLIILFARIIYNLISNY